MSFAICVYVPEAIILCTDSRQMMQLERRPIIEDKSEKRPDVPTRIISVATDTAEKVFNFFDKVGVAAIGEHVVDGQPLSFEIRNCVYNDCKPETSVQDVANALKRHFADLHPTARAQFFVAGFEEGGGTPFPEVYSVHTREKEVKQVNFHEGRVRYGCLWMGEGDVLTTILASTEVKDASGKLHKIQLPPIQFEGLTPIDARDFAMFSVSATETMQRFQTRPQTVGGRLQCLLIFPVGMVWAERDGLEGRIDDY